MGVSVCVGNYAEVPYCVNGVDMPVYSMEELCYCLKENAFLLDTSLMNDSLLTWIGENCGLKELAGELYPLVHKQGSLSAFVSMIMEYVGMYDTAAVCEMEQVLKKGAGLSGIERRKSQIDYLIIRKKYAAALREYDNLLESWREQEKAGGELPAKRVRAAILHNKGVALAGLMLYGQAAEVFWQANETCESPEHAMAYLAAKRMELSEGDYIALVAELPGSYEQTLALEKQLESLQKQWKEHPDYQRLAMRREWREGSEKQKYYDENERLTMGLKSSYRSSVLE